MFKCHFKLSPNKVWHITLKIKSDGRCVVAIVCIRFYDCVQTTNKIDFCCFLWNQTFKWREEEENEKRSETYTVTAECWKTFEYKHFIQFKTKMTCFCPLSKSKWNVRRLICCRNIERERKKKQQPEINVHGK